MTDVNMIIINSNQGQQIITCDSNVKNVLNVFYRSDPYGAYADFGQIIVNGFDVNKDEIVFVDEKNNWDKIEDFKIGTWLQPNDGNVLIPFRNDPKSNSQEDSHSLILTGVKKTKPFINKMTSIDNLKVSLVKAANFSI